MRHLLEKHQSVAPDTFTVLALAILAAALIAIYVVVSLATYSTG